MGEDLPATSNNASPGFANNSPMLAVDPTESRFVVMANRLDAPDFGCALQVSGDGGRDFVPANPIGPLPPGAEKCYGPEVDFDSKGNLYYLYLGLHGPTNTPMGAFVVTSADRGRTFAPPRQVLGPHNFAVHMAIDRSVGNDGRIHLAWLAANTDPSLNSMPPPPNPIMAAYSDNKGRTWSAPVQVSDPERQLVAAPALTLGPHGRVTVVYYDLGTDQRDYHGLDGPTWEEPWSVVVATSTDRGRTFGTGVTVDDGVVPSERVLLIFTMPPPSVTDAGTAVFVAWTDARNGDWDAFFRRSTDGGRTWGPPKRLNDDPVGDGRQQYQPRLALAPNGRLDAVFYDRRNDAENFHNDVFYTFSVDGGASFSPNLKLTSKVSDARVGPTYIGTPQGLAEYGSRMGLLASNSGVVAAWTDTRNAPLPEYQDLFTARVDLVKS